MLRHLPTALLILGPVPPVEATPAQPVQKTGQCSIDSLPEPQKRRLIDGYVSRHKTQGKASADAWAKAQEGAVYKQLVAQGACPATRGAAQTAKAPPRTGKKAILNRRGQPCRNIVVENQVFPGFGGEPMRMALVQVCKD
ncbi:hypothetical protein HZY97_14685 [Sphingomonas sp. R-74633]|uniref:hypothetical protein n=1 Tax=Sphingomonas sp. R-74633 TaxID=2751188 RepID=UPI0015D33E5C|nr:hypothetical protein [Sphingomonas sp. R-74633]NYT42014.1 hypothetical protein [Sphingomonas sp. R-74633]